MLATTSGNGTLVAGGIGTLMGIDIGVILGKFFFSRGRVGYTEIPSAEQNGNSHHAANGNGHATKYNV